MSAQKNRKVGCKTLLISKQNVQKARVTEYDNEEPEILTTAEKPRFKGSRIVSAKQKSETKNKPNMEKMKSQSKQDYFNINIFEDN